MQTLPIEIDKVMQAECKQGYLNASMVDGFDNWLKALAAKFPDEHYKALLKMGEDYASSSVLERSFLWQQCYDYLKNLPTHILCPSQPDVAKSRENQQALQASIQYLKGIGPKRATLFHKLDIYTVEDMLYYLPRDYDVRGDIVNIADIEIGQQVTIRGVIRSTSKFTTGKKLTILKALIQDATGCISAIWFNQQYLEGKLEQGREIILFGKSERKYKQVELSVQDFQFPDEESSQPTKVLPIYPSTGNLNQKNIRAAVKSAWDKYSSLLPEQLPEDLRLKYNFPTIHQALGKVHFPLEVSEAEIARKRLAYEELLILQLAILANRMPETAVGVARPEDGKVWEHFKSKLSFSLTQAQERVLKEVFQDLTATKPMTRLVQGDVGSGKTVIAAAALYYNAWSGYQGALMAPTEILANQHYESLQPLFTALGVRTALLIGDTKQKERREILEGLKSGQVQVIFGTHTLFQKDVEFNNLALAVTDEQHRFGVKQRSAFQQKGRYTDALVMTATPIPRTLAMTLYGDLEVSVIDELPPGRQQIKTYAVGYDKEERAWGFVSKEVDKGRQAYVVCPLVDESENLDLEAAVVLADRLSKKELKNYVVGVLHGKMKPKEKDELMQAFHKGEIQVLVATTVIEVGINVPNATIMVIRDAERFGLAQLHQLRGRVGRGSDQSYCILLNNAKSSIARERMKTMVQTTDGFIIAEADLRLRGAGDVFGTKQHGIAEMRFANLVRDVKLMELARKDALSLLESGGYEKTTLAMAVQHKIDLLNS